MDRKTIPAGTDPGVLAAAVSAGCHKYQGYHGWTDETLAMKVADFAAVLIEELNKRTEPKRVVVPKEMADQMVGGVADFVRKRGRPPKAGDIIPVDKV